MSTVDLIHDAEDTFGFFIVDLNMQPTNISFHNPNV